MPEAAVTELRREAGLARPQPAAERISHALRLFGRYWVSSDWMIAWPLLLVYIVLQFGVVYINVWITHWQQSFYNSIEARAVGAFFAGIGTFILISVLEVVQIVAGTVVQYLLSIRWRIWMTHLYLGRWIARDRFYEIERLRLIDNPDQRVAEDIKSVTQISTSPIGYLVWFITSITAAVSFGAILMQTSRPIRFTLLGYAVSLPGDMLWYSALWMLVGSVLLVWIGRPYIRRTMRAQHYEGDFRAGLLHVRRNAEQIASTGAMDFEKEGLRGAFDRIRHNWIRLMFANLGLNAGQGIYQRATSVLPIFLTVPRYFTGQISFGQIMSSQSAFIQFSASLSYFITAYPALATLVANVNRLKALDDAIDLRRPRGIAFIPSVAEAGITFKCTGLEVNRPHGAPLLHAGDWVVRDGERWVIEGSSGVGKTTLLRAITGLWPDGAGNVELTDRNAVMFVPQRLYIPPGTLKEAVCFPDEAERHEDAAIARLLEKVRLSPHVGAMNEVRVWQEELSPGEQQRVALARVLLHRPDFLVLDEATSALDADNAEHFHEVLLDANPSVTLVSVVHNDKLVRFHTHRLRIIDGRAYPEPILTVVDHPGRHSDAK